MIIKRIVLILAACFSFLQAAFSEMFVADPSIILDNGSYYLIGTNDFEGDANRFRIFRSEDLINWSDKLQSGDICYAPDAAKSFAGKRYVAPQIFKYGNFYYLAYGEFRIAIAKSKSITGPYAQDKIGVIEADAKQIDPFIFEDDDGKLYIYCAYAVKDSRIYVAELDKSFASFKEGSIRECVKADEPWENIDKREFPTAEGPTLIKRNGKYVLFYSANDFRSGDYAVGYAVSDTPIGPWTKAENNPIIRRDITGHNGSGHGDIFFDRDGNMWYVFHTHNSDDKVSPRRTAIVRLKESFRNGTPHYEADMKTFRFL